MPVVILSINSRHKLFFLGLRSDLIGSNLCLCWLSSLHFSCWGWNWPFLLLGCCCTDLNGFGTYLGFVLLVSKCVGINLKLLDQAMLLVFAFLWVGNQWFVEACSCYAGPLESISLRSFLRTNPAGWESFSGVFRLLVVFASACFGKLLNLLLPSVSRLSVVIVVSLHVLISLGLMCWFCIWACSWASSCTSRRSTDVSTSWVAGSALATESSCPVGRSRGCR